VITIVTGPPCGGKSTYIKDNAKDGDIIIDMDELARALVVGEVGNHDYSDEVRSIARAARKGAAKQALIAGQGNRLGVWIIHTDPPMQDRANYKLAGARIVECSPSWPPANLTPVDQESIDRGDGEFAIEFTEAFGSIGKDGVAGRAGQSLVLRPWQRELVRHVYARDADGGLKFRTALIGMPRKNGKSALSSAAFGLYSLIAEGIEGGEVYSVAAEKEQARIVFGEAKRMVETSELSELCTLYRDAIFVNSTNSVYRVVSAEAYSKEGLNPSRVIMDELHAHKDRTLFDVFQLAMGNRGKLGQLIAITTAGQKTDMTGQDSIAYYLYQYGKRVASGEVIDPAFFMAWWAASEEADHRDPLVWQSANPGYDDLVSADDFESAVRRTPEPEFRTKRLNQWVSSMNAWLPNGTWQPLVEQRELKPDDDIIIGFDGSFNGDCTPARH
jgi:phage terminase large subunit-like protein